jgi:hypothetical protein
MMNIIELQDKLKNFSQDQLVGMMQQPTSEAPQFMVLSEITRRQKMVNDDKIRQAKQNEMTVAQEAVAAAGVPQDGIAGMARAMAPKTDIAQNTGVMSQAPQAPPQAPPAPDQGVIMGMANGGYVKKMGLGGSVEPRPPWVLAVMHSKPYNNGIDYMVKPITQTALQKAHLWLRW